MLYLRVSLSLLPPLGHILKLKPFPIINVLTSVGRALESEPRRSPLQEGKLQAPGIWLKNAFSVTSSCYYIKTLHDPNRRRSSRAQNVRLQ